MSRNSSSKGILTEAHEGARARRVELEDRLVSIPEKVDGCVCVMDIHYGLYAASRSMWEQQIKCTENKTRYPKFDPE